MPLYNYVCSDCSETVELNKKIVDRDNIEDDICPSCGAVKSLSRALSAPLVAYSVSVNGGYGSKVPDGFKDVLNKIHARSPGSKLDKTSSYM